METLRTLPGDDVRQIMRAKDKVIRSLGDRLPFSHDDAVELPYIPPFLQKHDGLTFSIGQFNQWVANEVMRKINELLA